MFKVNQQKTENNLVLSLNNAEDFSDYYFKSVLALINLALILPDHKL